MSFDFIINESEKIRGVWIIKPSISSDFRGTIWTSFLKEKIEKLLPDGLVFNHDKFSISKNNVLRGIHGDNKSWKLVTCIFGEIFQVIVDARPKSPTYYTWEKFIINQENQILLLLPPKIGNSFYVNSGSAVYHYKLAYKGNYFNMDNQFVLRWNDSKLNIPWPCKDPILQDRDK